MRRTVLLSTFLFAAALVLLQADYCSPSPYPKLSKLELYVPDINGQNMIERLTSADFCNARQHLQCDICDTDLHYGMWAAGLADGYLPVPTIHEKEYWNCYHRQVRDVRIKKINAQLDSIFR